VNRIALIISLLAIVYALSGCGNQSPTFTPETVTPSTEPLATVPVEAPNVEDQASLLLALQSSGATAEVVDTVIQDFFTPEGSIVMVNGESVQVFEYESVEAMESEASQVASDGSSVGTSMMMWIDAPHFYRAGRIIVLYVGSNTTVLTLLDNVMGSQFAGR
jgi:hypothetical protein